MPIVLKRGVLLPVGSNSDDQMVKLRRDSTIFGRSKGDVIVDDPEISSSHCQIQEIDGVFNVFDMNSTNGTFINGDRVLKSALKDGDVLTIGKTAYVFTFRDEQKVQNIATVFRSATPEKRSNSSVIETLIDTEHAALNKVKVVLSVKYQNGAEEIISLDQRLIFIGRASSFGKFEDDSEMSRRHLLIKINDLEEIFVEDQGSTNGSFVNGHKLSGMQQISSEDTVLAGGTEIHVRLA